MRALKVLGMVALIGGGFMAGLMVKDAPVVVTERVTQEVVEIAAPGPAPVKEVPRDLICGEYTWANEDMTGCEVMPDQVALIENPVIEWRTEYVTITEYVNVPVTAPVTVRFFEDGSYRINETGQGGCPPMPLPVLCNAENF